jgi:hypothetical protein
VELGKKFVKIETQLIWLGVQSDEGFMVYGRGDEHSGSFGQWSIS